MGDRLTMLEEKAAWRMLAEKSPRTASAVRDRLDRVDGVRNFSRPGSHLFYKLGDEAGRLRDVLADLTGMIAPVGRIGIAGWESRSADEYARAEAAWQRNPARAELMAGQPGVWRLPPCPKRPKAGEDLSVRLDADAAPRASVNIAASAYATITDECARSGDQETGGWLIGGIAFSGTPIGPSLTRWSP